ncbi:MAG: hypothetical protein MOGMAGMI_01879 [Candidatus Omnitrophica bacterium]|nr:hypothetical protein [Candidatus Omnitrophota bacterium]
MERLIDFLRWTPRSYPVPQAIDPSMVYHGIDTSTFTPPEYAEYVAISNGVYACVNVRASNLSGLPLKVYGVKANGDKDEVTNGPVTALFQKVNPYWTVSRLLNMTEQSLGVWGQCFWVLDGWQGGKPTEIWWVRADRMKVHPHPTKYISHYTYDPNGGRPQRFEPHEVVWFRYPNPNDEYSGLSPLAAARIAADTASAAMQSNFNIFRNGMGAAGFISPGSEKVFTKQQAEELQTNMDKRFRGVDKAHRMGVLTVDAKFQQVSMTPKDAEFLGALNWSLEDIARAYRVPIDKIGGKRTYQNVEESELVFWNDCLLPEARMIAQEITEQLLPLFGSNLIAEFDTSDIAVLQEDEQRAWEIAQGKIAAGVMTVNEWREAEGLDPQPWGDVWWAQSTLIPIDSNEKPAPVMPPMLGAGDADQDDADDAAIDDAERMVRALASGLTRATYAYGSPEHEAKWRYIIEQEQPWEGRIGRACADLMQRQKASILSDVTRASKREANPDEPFDKAKWIKTFRVTMRPIIAGVVEEAGTLAANELGFRTAFDVLDPNVVRAIERQTQRFAEEVNDTTWQMLKDALREGIIAGEGQNQLAERVEAIMADRIRSSKETIARTEAHLASTQGTHQSWAQSGVVEQVEWLAALDDRTRMTHVEAHGQRVKLGDDFQVGSCSGPGPGMTGCAGEDVNCRCVTIPILDVQAAGLVT